MSYRTAFNPHGLYNQEQSERDIYRGYTIDSKNARILDDGFKISRHKNGGYLIEYYIADTALFFQSLGEKPHIAKRDGKHEEIDVNDFRSHCSLTNDTPKPAIRIAFVLDENAFIVSKSIKRVLFENIHQMTDETYKAFRRKNPEEAALQDECTSKISNNYMTNVKDINSPIQALSTLVNGQLTAYCHARHLPILYQSHRLKLNGSKDTFYCFERAQQAALKSGIIDHPSQFQRDVHYFFEKKKRTKPFPIESTTTKAQFYARFTSPMRNLYDAINIQILCAHLEKTPVPYTVDELKTIIRAVEEKTKEHEISKKDSHKGSRKQHRPKRRSFN